MTHWFGSSWGAPICEPEEHVETPTGAACLYCEWPITPEDNGVVMPLGHADHSVTLEAAHRLCFLKTVLPHGPGCVRCRGLSRTHHKMRCSNAKHGGNCNCPHGEAMQRLLDPSTTLADAETIALRLGLDLHAILDAVKRDQEHADDQMRRRAAHNPGDDQGKRKAP